MSLPHTAADLLAALADVLEEQGIRWYVFGAQAVVLWGAPRMSADVDVTVQMPLEEAPVLAEAMEPAGFRLRIQNVESFVAETRVLPFLHVATKMPLDVVLAGPGLEELFLDRVLRVELSGKQIPVISPEDLIVAKILAGRAKDIEDVRGILKERMDRLDIERIRETFGLLEEALGQSDLLPLFEAERKRASAV